MSACIVDVESQLKVVLVLLTSPTEARRRRARTVLVSARDSATKLLLDVAEASAQLGRALHRLEAGSPRGAVKDIEAAARKLGLWICNDSKEAQRGD